MCEFGRGLGFGVGFGFFEKFLYLYISKIIKNGGGFSNLVKRGFN